VDHDDVGGLTRDLRAVLDRRSALQVLAGTSLLALVGCGSRAKPGALATPSPSASATATAAGGVCAEIPQETAGPFPCDGSNGPNVLNQAGVVRSDIRRSFGGASGVAVGVPLTLVLAVQDAACRPLDEAAVYVWHCTRDGGYSLYSQGIAQENYLRGLQPANPDGTVTFLSVFPGAYSGRYPHVHFEVHASVADAAAGLPPLATSQLALPAEACNAVYATPGYEQSKQSFAQTSLQSDNVFGDDGGARQLASVTGSVAEGYTARLSVPVS